MVYDNLSLSIIGTGIQKAKKKQQKPSAPVIEGPGSVEHAAAKVIQSAWRKYRLHAPIICEHEEFRAAPVFVRVISTSRMKILAARIVQSIWRKRRDRRLRSAIVIQKFWRGYSTRVVFNNDRRRRNAAFVLQCVWRKRQTRRSIAARLLQKVWRGAVVRLQLDKERIAIRALVDDAFGKVEQDMAASTIQRYWSRRLQQKAERQLHRISSEIVNDAISIAFKTVVDDINNNATLNDVIAYGRQVAIADRLVCDLIQFTVDRINGVQPEIQSVATPIVQVEECPKNAIQNASEPIEMVDVAMQTQLIGPCRPKRKSPLRFVKRLFSCRGT